MTEFARLITELLSNPVFWVLAIVYYLVAAAIGAMEMPDATSSKAYRYWFRFLNKFAANLDRAADALKLPHVGEPPSEKADSAAAGK